MKLICINNLNGTINGLTIGKIYDGEQSGLIIDEVKFYKLEINDDKKTNMVYHRKHIIPLQEFRNKQINNLLEK